MSEPPSHRNRPFRLRANRPGSATMALPVRLSRSSPRPQRAHRYSEEKDVEMIVVDEIPVPMALQRSRSATTAPPVRLVLLFPRPRWSHRSSEEGCQKPLLLNLPFRPSAARPGIGDDSAASQVGPVYSPDQMLPLLCEGDLGRISASVETARSRGDDIGCGKPNGAQRFDIRAGQGCCGAGERQSSGIVSRQISESGFDRRTWRNHPTSWSRRSIEK